VRFSIGSETVLFIRYSVFIVQIYKLLLINRRYGEAVYSLLLFCSISILIMCFLIYQITQLTY